MRKTTYLMLPVKEPVGKSSLSSLFYVEVQFIRMLLIALVRYVNVAIANGTQSG